MLAVAIVDGGPHVWVYTIDMLTPLRPGEADDTWVLAIAWKVALMSACLIAAIASPLWGLLVWCGRSGYLAAICLGFALSSLIAVVLFAGNDSSAMTKAGQCLLIGLTGALSGVVTLSADRGLTRLVRAA